nr:DNA-directed DNA polymerase [Tanacetum cinerariifolium]
MDESTESFFIASKMALEKDDTEAWTLYIDGASKFKGSRASLVLISPSCIEYTYALRLKFVNTNNEAKNEALSACLRIARRMKMQSWEAKKEGTRSPILGKSTKSMIMIGGSLIGGGLIGDSLIGDGLIGGGLIGGSLENGGLDNGGLDKSGLDNSGLDNDGLDNGGLLRAAYPVSHVDVDVDNFKRCCTSNTSNVGYWVHKDLIFHRSSINNNARLSNKFKGLHFIFTFGISGLLHQVITTIADKYEESMKKAFQNMMHGLEEVNPTHAYYNGSKTSKDNEDPSWSTSEITQEVLNATDDGIFIYKTPNQAYQRLEDKVLLKLDWAKNQKTKSPLKKIIAFTDKGRINTNTDKIMARMDAMTIKIDAQYKKLQYRAEPDLDDDDMPMSREEEAKFMQTFSRMPNYGKFLKELISNKNEIEQIYVAYLSDESSTMIQNKVPPKLKDPGSLLILCNFNKTFSRNALADLGASINLMPYFLYAKLSLETLKPSKMSVRLADRSFQCPVGIAENMLVKVVIQVKKKQLNLRVGTERMIFNIDYTLKHSYSNDDTCFSIDVIDEILEEDFDAILDEGSKILYSIEGILLEEEIFAEFDEIMAMITDETSESESNTEEPPFKKITINANYKIKTSLKEPLMYLELKPLPDNLEYVFLEEPSFLLVIISFKLSTQNKSKRISVLKKHKEAFAWKTTDMPGICSSFCKHMIQLLDDKKPVVQKQRRLNLNIQEVVKKEIVKLLDTSIIYLIADSPWVSPIHCVPKKGGITVVTNENDELVPTRTVTGWRVCIDYRKLNEATVTDHFPLSFMDQMLEILAGNKYLCFLDGFSGYFQIPIDHMDQ